MTSATGEDWSRADQPGAGDAAIIDEIAQDQTQVTAVAAVTYGRQATLQRQLGVPRPH